MSGPNPHGRNGIGREPSMVERAARLASSAVRLNGGTLNDVYGRAGAAARPFADLSAVRVNGSNPLVSSVARLDPNPTNTDTVRFQVTFTEPVTGVDLADFGVSATGLTGTAVTDVSGPGAVYVVTVRTGAGSGTLGPSVPSAASAPDTDGNLLGAGFPGGEVYTLNRHPARTIDTYYERGHGDFDLDYGAAGWNLNLHPDSLGERAPSTVLVYGGPAGLQTTPTGPQWAFLGAGPQSYLFPQSGANADVPYLGIGPRASPG